VTVPTDQTELREVVRARYAAAATTTTERNASCCSAEGAIITEAQRDQFGSPLYDQEDRDQLPDAAVLASLGCGNPIAIAELHEGETVLDLGSGGGIDVLLSAKRVEAGVTNVQWLRGQIEEIPLPRETVDVIISNCVINLSGDKPQVLREAARVLKPGGRFAVSDVVADPDMDDATRADMAAYTGCIAGALTRAEFTAALQAAGLTDISITETHRVHASAASAIVRATKPDPGCCDTTAQAACCEPTDKADCCGAEQTSAGGCGCKAAD
jgi:arsenite methyltransferase